MKAESRQIPQKLAARLKFVLLSLRGDVAGGVGLDFQLKMILGLIYETCTDCIPERAFSTRLT